MYVFKKLLLNLVAKFYVPSQKSPKNPALQESHLLLQSTGSIIITAVETPTSRFCAKIVHAQPMISQDTSQKCSFNCTMAPCPDAEVTALAPKKLELQSVGSPATEKIISKINRCKVHHNLDETELLLCLFNASQILFEGGF